MSALLGVDYRANQATYDLRRLRLKGLIERMAHTNRYRVTEHGRAVATFFTRLAKRVVVPALAALRPARRASRGIPPSLAVAWRDYDREIQQLVKRSKLAA
jgi:predicted MarR family transcription regulator